MSTAASDLDDHREAPSAFCAFVLSLLCPGLGQLYVGATGRGLALLGSLLLFAPAVLGLCLAPAATPIAALLVVLGAAIVGLQLFAPIDAACLARRRRRAHGPLGPGLLALLIAVGVSYPAATMWWLRASVLQMYRIAMSSMEPTLAADDLVMVNKLDVKRHEFPRRGDLVVFSNPSERRQALTKRVVALPGDEVQWRDGRLLLNGAPLRHDPIPAERLTGREENPALRGVVEENAGRRYAILEAEHGETLAPITVAPGHCYVVGDHRPGSRDSRHFGSVPIGDVAGRVEYVIVPADDWQRFGTCDRW